MSSRERVGRAGHEGASKVALVTGAGSGIGRAVALELLAHDYRVALAGRHRETLEQ
ncbi:MAG: SDR family NAD(P)-dependent oxidoreductase, partial [Castellaniella sp.]|uniref:SDR family NAD(P)-dependent oxidoreductase n=1 Tax=Castellaniella sp. TaxID=1955812 RepID=UPI00120F887F